MIENVPGISGHYPALPGTYSATAHWHACCKMTLFMEFFCRHCDEAATGSMYRVLSVENGIVMLDMVVCRSCYDQARQLGLDGEEIKLDHNSRKQLPVVRSITETAHQY